jgi:hypothetical protein
MTYIDQNSTELRLSLTNSNFNREPLNVICSKEIILNGFEIEFGILGASHFVSIKKDDFDFTEIFACISLDNVEFIKSGEFLSIDRKFGDFDYMFNSKVVPWSASGFHSYHNSNKNVLKYNGLTFEFPSEVEGNFKALTNIYVYEHLQKIHVKTIHAYPNEDNVVITSSIINKS